MNVLRQLLPLAALSALVPVVAVAHPHVFADARLEVVASSSILAASEPPPVGVLTETHETALRQLPEALGPGEIQRGQRRRGEPHRRLGRRDGALPRR